MTGLVKLFFRRVRKMMDAGTRKEMGYWEKLAEEAQERNERQEKEGHGTNGQ